MSSSKAALKAIKSAIDTGDFDAATTKAEQLTTEDKQNYTAYVYQRRLFLILWRY